ncbi:MAG: helix-turn-helix transcriptional regulator [Chloroflexi bacterium]|nr:helix-turn-helix transcriptional regulator [Chloroflexota bacterium]
MTQQQLADRVGMHQNHINRLENDRMQPRTKTVDKLASALEVTVEELVNAQVAIPPSVLKDDPELADLLGHLALLNDEQRHALRTFLRSMITCQQVQRLTTTRALAS